MNCSIPEINKQTLDVINNLGESFTLNYFRKNNLSNFSSFNELVNNNSVVYSEARLQEIVEKFLPRNVFQVKHLDEVIHSFPSEAQAAFFKDVLYFGNNVNKEQIAEETFHAIFQRLIPFNLKEKYLKEGRSLIDNIEKQKEDYLKSYPKTQLLTNKELEERVVEEAIAKSYVEYFNKNISPSNKKGILKLLENLFKWLKGLFNKLNSDSNLEVFFENIIKGKFTKSIIQNTNESEVPTLRLVEYQTVDESGNTLKRNLSVKESEFLIASLGGFVLEINQLDKEILTKLGLVNRTKRVQFAIEKLKEHYSENPKFQSALTEHTEVVYNPDELDFEKAFTTKILPNLKNLKEDVNTYLNVVTGVELKNDDINEDEVAELDFSDNISANEKGFEGMSAWLRSYIATTGTEVGKVDVDGKLVSIVAPIDKNKVYYSLARSMQNTTHELARLYKFVTIGSLETNKETKVLLDRIIKDVVSYKDEGGNEIEDVTERFTRFKDDVTRLYGIWKNDKKKYHYLINDIEGLKEDKTFILQTLLQGFDLWKRDNYRVMLEQKSDDSPIITKVFEANQNSASKVQVDMWKTKWEEYFLNEEIKEKIRNRLREINKRIERNKEISIDDAYEILNIVFFDVDKKYVEYLFGGDDIGGTFTSNATLEDVKVIFEVARDDLRRDKSLLYDNKDGIKGRAEKIAQNTSKINEEVIESTYKDAENKTRYSYQNKTFQLYMFNELFSDDNFDNYLKSVKEGEIYEYADKKFLTQASSFLYQGDNNKEVNHISFLGNDFSKDWNEAFKKGDFYSVDGLDGGIGSTTFGSMTNRDFLIWKLHLKAFKTKGTDEKKGIKPTQPIHINIMEAKRTSSFKEVMLVEELYKEGEVTEKAIGLFKNEILREVRRMYDEKSKIINWLKILAKDNGDGEFKVELTRDEILANSDLTTANGIIEKYHTGNYKIKKTGDEIEILETKVRALQFTDNVKSMLTPDTFAKIVNKVFVSEKLNVNDINIDSEIKNQLTEYIKEFKDLVRGLKGILPITSRYGNLNENPNKFQISDFINDELSSWLNTIWVNQLINSDSALLVKNDGADFVKRAGGQNAAIASLSTTFYSPKLKGIKEFDKIKYVVGNDPQGIIGFKTKEKVDSADAQSYMTVDAYLKYLYSTSKLSDESAEILMKIKEGIDLTEEDKKYMKENDVFFNVIKPVGYDGYFYFKTGTVMLTKDLTSVNVDGVWIAKPGREALHNLREKMENSGVDYYLGQTASKQLTINKYTEDFDNISFSEKEVDGVWNSSVNIMSTKFFGQQMENPAGKEKIIDPSQMLEIILNEQNENVNVFLKGEKLAIGKLLKQWQQLSINRLDISFNQAMNEIADENLTLQYNKFLDRIKETLASSGADDQLLEIFSLDEHGNPKYNLNMSLSIDKFINLLMSHFSKGVLQQKVAGDAMALVSPHGVNGIKKIVKYKTEDGKDVYSWEYIKTSDPRYKEIIKQHKSSPFKNLSNVAEYDEFDSKSQLEGGSNALIDELKKLYKEGEDVYFIDQLRFGKPTYAFNKEGKVIGVEHYSAEALLPKHKEGINIDDVRNIFGLRIPSQDKQSGVNIEWVDEIPEYYGNTIISPKEIQYLSGSDYDIDKLYIHRKETFEKDGKEVVWSKEHNTFEMYKYYHTTKNIAVKQRINKLLSDNSDYIILSFKAKEIREKYKEEFNNFEGFINEQNDKITEIGNLITITKASKKEKQKEIYELNKKELFKEIKKELEVIKKDLEKQKEIENLINFSKNKIISINDLLKNEKTTIEQVEKELEILKKSLIKEKLSTLYEEGGVKEIEEKYIDLIDKVREEKKSLSDFFEALKVLKQRKEIKEKTINVVFEEYKLITSEKEFNETEGIKILPIINNEMLDMKMRFLMNPHTLDRSEGEAISLTPATQDNLKELIVKTYILKDGHPYYLFKKDGKDEFTTDVKYSTHSTLGQNIAHKNVVTGKRNIGVAVVANLLHLFSKKANISLRDSIKIIDVTPVNDGLHELTEYNLSTFTIGKNIKNQRIADIISELISAATDEAKDQQNAKYGLTIEALNIVTPILMLGGSLDFAIRLVNSEKVKAYLNKVSVKDNIAKTKEEKEELQTSNELLLASMLSGDSVTPSPVSIVNLKEGKNNDDALALAAKMLTISKEIGLAKYVINLKKGLGKTLDEFEQGEDKIASTTKEKLAPVHLTNMPKVFNQENENLAIYKSQIEKHNKLSELFDKNVLSRKKEFQYFKYFYLNNFKAATYEEARKWLNDNMISFIYSRLYFNYLKSENDLNGNDFRQYTNEKLENVEEEWGKFVKGIRSGKINIAKETVEEIRQNPLITKLKTNKQGRIIAPTFVKGDIATNTSLLESFWDLHVKLSNVEEPYNNLMWKLFHYSIHKDGWTFKGGSLSKVIPPVMYSKHSKSLDEFINNESVFTGEYTNGFLVYSAIERSVRAKDGEKYIKKANGKQENIWKQILREDGIINVNDFYNLKENDLTWLSDNGYIITTPDKQIILQFPLYHKFYNPTIKKDSIFRIEKLNVTLEDGTTRDVSPEQYFYYLNKIDVVNELKYSFVKENKDKNQYLISTSISDEIKIEKIKIGEKIKEQKEDVSKSENISDPSIFSYKGKSIRTEFVLGEEQQQVLKDLIDFVQNGNTNETDKDVITLQGQAGTGKTSVIGYLQKYLKDRYSFAYLAPTHAATAELALATVKTGNIYLPSTVTSSIVYNAKKKTHVFSAKVQKKLLKSPVIVVDESSMLDNSDIDKLKEAALDSGASLIFIGDEKQIPKVTKDSEKTKLVSKAFTDFRQLNLTKIYRQSENSLLFVLNKIREQKDFKLFKTKNTEAIQFLNKKGFNKNLTEDVLAFPESTVVISYTNNSVKSQNLSLRALLGREGDTQVGDIVMGYLGYASKQIEKGDIANSISYTIDKIENESTGKVLHVSSKKLQSLVEKGIVEITKKANTVYYQLSNSDALTFSDLSSNDFEKNNEIVSGYFRVLHNANVNLENNTITYIEYLDIIASISEALRKVSVGDTYVFNPSSNRMERYNPITHKNIKTSGQGSLLFEKDIDYGHAITIHKSQGTTIDNVYFDTSSLASAPNTQVIDLNKNQITTEKQALAYVAMSRSKNKLVVYEGDIPFEMIEVPKTEIEEKQLPDSNSTNVESKKDVEENKQLPFDNSNFTDLTNDNPPACI